MFDKQKEHLGEFFDQLSKMVLLESIDQKWKEHLQFVDHLRESVNLRAYAQKDPLVEYKKEAFTAFQSANLSIRSEVVEKILKVRIMAPDETEERLKTRNQKRNPRPMEFQGSEASDSASFLNSTPMQDVEREFHESHGGPRGGDEGPKLNRAQRNGLIRNAPPWINQTAGSRLICGKADRRRSRAGSRPCLGE